MVGGVLTAEAENTTRKPLLLFRLSGVFLFRLAERAFWELLFQDPPRNTRFPRHPCGGTFPQSCRMGTLARPVFALVFVGRRKAKTKSGRAGVPILRDTYRRTGEDGVVEQVGMQRGAVGVSGVSEPTDETAVNCRQIEFTPRERGLHRMQPAALSVETRARQPASIGEDAIAEKPRTIDRARDDGLLRVQPQPHRREELAAGGAVRVQFQLVIAEQGEVVHIADIARDTQPLFHEVVERIQQHVREELTGLVADRQAATAVTRRQQIVTGKPALDQFLRIRVIDDGVDQRECLAVLDLAGDGRFQDLVIDGRKELSEVALQHVAVRTGEVLEAVHGGVRSLSFPAGVAVVNEGSLEDWFQHVAQGVMDHAVAEGGRADHPPLRLEDFKRAVRAGLIRAADQFVLQSDQLGFEVEAEPGDVAQPPLTSGGVAGRRQQVVEARQFRPQTAVSLHAHLPRDV